jgi:competence protein ComEC
MMKTLLNSVLSLIMLVGLTACGANVPSKTTDTVAHATSPSPTQTETAKPLPSPQKNDATPKATQSAPHSGKQLVVTFINVGQGDSILVQMPNGKSMLVDGGRRTAGDKVVAYLKKAGVTSLDRLVATHPDADHIGGLVDVLQQFNVKKVIDSGKDHTSETYMDYLKLVDQKDIPFHVAKTGEKLDLDPAVDIKVLNSGNTAPTDENNDSSIVLKITYGKVSVLLTGDAPKDVEKQMMENGEDVSATILKPGHHGSSTSSSLEFLEAVHPKVAVLSYGENDYGHPNSGVVSRLRQVGAKVYSTFASGDIVVSTDGATYQVSAKPWTGKGVDGAPDTHFHSSDNTATVNHKININTAGLSDLESINGIGPAIAQNIIDYRNEHGPFQTIDELDNVYRIGPATIDKIRPYITLK